MAQLSDDCFAHGGALMRVDEARRLLAEANAPVTASEPVGLHQALGRILAEDIVTPVDIPPAPNAAADGYAVRHDALAPENAARLPVGGAGTAGTQDLTSHQSGITSSRERWCTNV